MITNLRAIGKNRQEKRHTIYGTGAQSEAGILRAYIPKTHLHLSKVTIKNIEKDIIDYLQNRLPNVKNKCEELTVNQEITEATISVFQRTAARAFWRVLSGRKLWYYLEYQHVQELVSITCLRTYIA
ncbi:hypothetical protein HHI36_016858 [Cryptolaemus montrouzieri]|uniref:Uncharacterized protein n=1 Tax=Cryptolaemus montrouzieri TaxID=559131 RepID=A0ABD2NKZ1_9CUCU